MSLTRTKYTKEEKLAIVKEFAQSKMSKCKFVAQHPEYKRTTLFSWLKLYFSESTEALEKELCKLRSEVKQLREKDSKQAAELKKNEKELNHMKDALAEYAVKEAFLKKVQAYFGKNDGEQ